MTTGTVNLAERTPPYSASFGYSLALRVLQSSLYAQLHADEKRECDELIRRGQAPASPSEPACDGAFEMRHGKGTWHSLDYPFPLLREEFQAGRASCAQEAPALPPGAEGLVWAVAVGGNTQIGAMFDTAQQAHAFVHWLKQFTDAAKQSDCCTLGGGLPGDHNGEKAALAAAPPLPATPEQPLHPRLKSTPYGPAILLDDVRDAQRMDWLECQDLNDIATIRQTNSVVGINVGSGPFYGKTLRAAIDAAIQQEANRVPKETP